MNTSFYYTTQNSTSEIKIIKYEIRTVEKSVFYLPPYFQSTQHSCAPQPERKLKAVRYLDVPNDSKIFPGDNLLAARLSEPKRFHNTDQSEWARPI